MPSTSFHTPQKVASLERRRTNKPIMEKKRRARINDCLNTLKNLVLEAMKKDPSRYDKLEKADILEMTVKHVRKFNSQEPASHTVAPPRHQQQLDSQEAAVRYRTGYSHCASEVTKFLAQDNTLSSAARTRMMQRLQNNLDGLQIPKASATKITNVNSQPSASPSPSLSPSPSPVTSPVMDRLTSGQVSLIVPSVNLSGSRLPPQADDIEYHQAPPSPPLSHTSSPIPFQHITQSYSYTSLSPPNYPCHTPTTYSYSHYPFYNDTYSSSCSRSPSPQPLDLAPVRIPESDNDKTWRPW
ncbi:unnamed protein product [Meganyctiphanes norvegica]|uniref:Uncharacterized protein n=1 Tax=Meganyctiphanes norvegica TaxID=48144 RepID=A0AAV2R5W3_MEGNR